MWPAKPLWSCTSGVHRQEESGVVCKETMLPAKEEEQRGEMPQGTLSISTAPLCAQTMFFPSTHSSPTHC